MSRDLPGEPRKAATALPETSIRTSESLGFGPSPVHKQAPTHVRYLVLTLACAISFVLYLHRYAWGFAKRDLQAEFGWDPVTLGWLDGLFGAAYGAGQVPAGMLGDWFGAHLLLGVSILTWSLALLAVTVATGITSMAAARVTFGVAQASCYPVLNKVSKNWFPVSMRTTAQGWIATFFGRAGGAASFVLFGTVLLGWLELPWRVALIAISLLGVACGVLFLLLFRNTPGEHPWANAAEAELILAGDPQAVYATRSLLRWSTLLHSVVVWFMCVRAFISNLADVVYVYWLPLYLLEVKGVSTVNAGWLAALPLIGGALGGLTSGMLQSTLIQRTGNRRWARSGIGFTGKLLAGVFMLASLGLDAAWLIALLFLVVKYFSDWEQPAEWGTISDIAGRNAATVFACVNTAGSLGGFVAGPLTGFVLRSYQDGGLPTTAGWNAVFVIIAMEYFGAAVCWVFIDCRKPLEPPAV